MPGVLDRADSAAADRAIRCQLGHTHWGAICAAGLFVTCGRAVLLGTRSRLVTYSDLWGIPGGARQRGETARQTALRETTEEVGGLAATDVELRDDESIDDHGNWTYTTVFARVRARRPPMVWPLDAETARFRWFDLDDLPSPRQLHPGLRRLFEADDAAPQDRL